MSPQNKCPLLVKTTEKQIKSYIKAVFENLTACPFTKIMGGVFPAYWKWFEMWYNIFRNDRCLSLMHFSYFLHFFLLIKGTLYILEKTRIFDVKGDVFVVRSDLYSEAKAIDSYKTKYQTKKKCEPCMWIEIDFLTKNQTEISVPPSSKRQKKITRGADTYSGL